MLTNFRLMAGGAAMLATMLIVSTFRGSNSTSSQRSASNVVKASIQTPIQTPQEQTEAFASGVEPTAANAYPRAEGIAVPISDSSPQTVQATAAKRESSREPNSIASSATIANSANNPQVCSGDVRSNSTNVYAGENIGSSQVVPLLDKEAARIRSSPRFGNNVMTCLLPSHTVVRTGTINGIWSQVQLGDGTRGWIATEQLKN